jgi:Effector Associated Constant Component 1
VETTVRLSGAAVPGDELRSLRNVLLGEDELRGRVRALERAPQPGTLGPELEALQIIGGSAGLSGILIAWIKNRRGNWTLHLKRSDGAELDFSSDQARSASPEQIRALAAQLSALLDASDAGP